MAIIKVLQYQKNQFGGAPPYGNHTVLPFSLLTNATGAALNSNSQAAIAAGDVVVLGTLPAGMRLEDAQLIIKTGMTATITGSLGFRYKDGVDSVDVPQDAAYFLAAGADLATAARLRANTAKLVTLPKDAELILTTAVAPNAKVSELHALIVGELTGPV